MATVPAPRTPGNRVRLSEAFAPVVRIALLCREAGGRALLVGGAVRDLCMAEEGRPAPPRPPDLDVEVHGLEHADLRRVLGRLGPVNLVGQAFAVYKMTVDGVDVDVSLPRRDSRAGPGHRGVRAEGDPGLGVREAARRRDLTINAIALDPLTGAVEDPFDGVGDLGRRLLRAVDPATFGDDPLRALRVPQFAGRFGFAVHPDLEALCAAMPLEELPAERVRGEVRKLLLLSPRPSVGLEAGARLGVWARILPALADADWRARGAAVDRAARLRDARYAGDEPRAEALLLATLLHGLTGPDLESSLDRLAVFRQGGFPLRVATVALVTEAPRLAPDAGDGALRLASRRARPAGALHLWLSAAEAILGDAAFAALLARAETLGVHEAPPPPLVRGRDLRARGMPAGPAMGRLLEAARRHQLETGETDPDVLLDWTLALAGRDGAPHPAQGDGSRG